MCALNMICSHNRCWPDQICIRNKYTYQNIHLLLLLKVLGIGATWKRVDKNDYGPGYLGKRFLCIL